MSEINSLKKQLGMIEYVQTILPDEVRLNTWIAAGGQGVVYRGHVNGHDAAIKLYYPGQLRKRIEREIKAMQNINCDSIVRFLWQNELILGDYDLLIVATEFVDGQTLSDLVRERGLDVEEIGVIAYDVAKAIEAMWLYKDKVVHRDLKPSNVLIRNSDGRACVIDLGFARHIDQTSLTLISGATYGTLGYLSPEQVQGVRSLTWKSDIYALGIILVECAMGRHPTLADQDRLINLDWSRIWPQKLQRWKHGELVKKMLNSIASKRPSPKTILEQLEEFSPQYKNRVFF